MVNVDSDTNFSRYGGMKDKLGIERTEKDYDIHYDGSKEMQKTHPIADPINDPDITQINSNSYPKSPHFSTAEKYENKIATDPNLTVNKAIIGDIPTYNDPVNTTGTPIDPNMTTNKIIVGDIPTYSNPMNTTGTPTQIVTDGYKTTVPNITTPTPSSTGNFGFIQHHNTGDPIKEAIVVTTAENKIEEKHTSSSKFGTYDPGEDTCCGGSCDTCVDKE